MPEDQPNISPEISPNCRTLRIVVLGLCLLIATLHLLSTAAGHPFYRVQHIGTALIYARGTIDFLHPVIPGFNANGAPTALEPPIWQAAAALMFKCFGPWWGWANVTSLVIFLLGLWPLKQLATAHLGPRGGWWTLVIFLLQPLVMIYAGTAGLCLVLALWFLYGADRLVFTQSWPWLLPAGGFGALAATMKLPFFIAVALAGIGLIFLHGARAPRRWLLLTLAGAVSTLVFMLWNRFIGSSYAQAEYPFWNMRLKDNPEMWRWYFGDWQSRLNVATWAQGLWRMLNCTWGRFALALTTLWALLFSRRQLACYWFLATVVTVLIFSNIVLVHRHYYLMFTAPAAMLAAAAVLKMEALLRETKKHSLALTEAGILVALVVAAVQGLIGVKIVENYDPYPHAIAQARREYTAPDDKVIIFGGGWGGKELILADRTGLSIAKMQLLDDDRAYARLRELGFNRLVMLSESPLNHALQMTNPGQARLQRWMYRQCMTPKAAQFGTLYGIRGSDHQVTALMMNETKRC